MELQLKMTKIQLRERGGDVYLKSGFFIEGDGFCAIYSNGYFDFVCTADYELDHVLATRNLILKSPREFRFCSECKIPITEGFYFESLGMQYCDEICLEKVISWEEYMKIYDDGNGDAYWTTWEDE